MASRVLINAIPKRQMSVDALKARSAAQSDGLQVSKLPNGLVVASVDNNKAVSTVGVVVKAGSRNETHDNQGVSHVLRAMAGMGTKNNSSFGIVRNLQQIGSGLVCTQGREHTMYASQVTKDNLDAGVDYLFDAVGNQMFKPWEVAEVTGRIATELVEMSPATRCTELLHKAAFREGLGNSLYTPEFMVGKHKSAALQAFHSKLFTSQRAALVGVGVDHGTLLKYADLLQLESGAGPSSSGKYFGGELRHECGGKNAYIAIGGSAAGAGNAQEAIANMVLQRILGGAPGVKRSAGTGRFQKAASGPATAANAFNFVYADAALLGAFIATEASNAGKAVDAVFATLKDLSVTEAEVNAAKKKLTVDIAAMLEEPLLLAEDMGAQALIAGDVLPAEAYSGMINTISVADVQAAAKRLSSGKLSMSAVGNLSTVPYLDSL